MASEIPNMKTKRKHWRVPALITFIALVLAGYFLPPLARDKEKPQRRIQAVNNIVQVLDVKQSTNPASAASAKK